MHSHYLQTEPRRAVAAALIDSGCVSVCADEPFRLPSGWASPVYMDGRQLVSFPAARKSVLAHATDLLRSTGALQGLAGIAGGESSGIALAAWLADASDLPLQYVRKRAAGHRHVEGCVQPGGRILLVDDVMAIGQSKVQFCRALAAAGARVTDILVVFAYDTFPMAAGLASADVGLHVLSTWRDVLAVARDRGDFTDAALDTLEGFLNDPVGWSRTHGGWGPAIADGTHA
ncbi:orotate phosphoribosyltransferase [Pseudorhodoferax sp.]|uniref:orotate phosphoribosyltransferase n=1 Tax=Pseudorhodoferax sp. TaxID=1993553 RepID=UPI0039E566D9